MLGRRRSLVAEACLVVLPHDAPQKPLIAHRAHQSEETMMSSYTSGELVWDTTEAKAPRWILLMDGPPEATRQRVASQDPSTPQAATPAQLRELIRRALHEDTGHCPVSVTMTPVKYKQRFRFGATF